MRSSSRRNSAVLACVVGLAVACGGGVEGVERYTLESVHVGRSLEQVLVVSGGQERRPLLVFLHGRDGDPDDLLVEELESALDELGGDAPAVLFPSGGEASYWHDRRDGDWGTYVLREAIPAAVQRSDVDGRRVAIGGISMGGFGALDLARRAPQRFCAVGAHSAALWHSGAESPVGAFDDAEDFARHDVLAAARAGERFGRGRVWLDVGAEDPFRRANESLARALGNRAELHVWPGSHTPSYSRAHLDEYLRFYAQELRRCVPK